ncbi:MAG: TolC family protein, partial [Myxococcales bacterium]
MNARRVPALAAGLLCLAALLAPLPSSADGPPRRPISLREAMTLAAAQSPELAMARSQEAVASAQLRRAWGAWRPELTASASGVRTSAPAALDLGGIVQLVGGVYGLPPQNPQLVPPPVNIVGEYSAYGTLQFSQPLFTPQGAFLLGPAKAGVEAAQKGAREAREQVLLNVARAWLGLKGIEDLLAAAKEAERVATAREQDAQRHLNAGTGVELALLRAQTETAAARSQIAALEGQRESLFELLSALVDDPVAPAPGPADELPLGTADEAAEPWKGNFRVQSAEAQVRAFLDRHVPTAETM